MKAVAKLAYLLACAAVIAALATELVLRLEHRNASRAARRYAEANVFERARDLAEGGGQGVWLRPGIRYRPGASVTLQAGGESYEIRINSLGFRTREFSPRKSGGTFRVLCIGGSTTAQGRTNDETYPALLEAKLRQARQGRGIEVLNLGVSGTQSEYWMARLDQLFGFEPDLVIEYEFVNDLFFGHLNRYAADHAWRARLSRSLLASRLLPLDPAELDPYLLGTLRRFRRIAREAETRGAAYLVGSFAGPDPERAEPAFRRYLDLNVEAWARGSVLRSYAEYHRLLARHNERLEVFARENRLRLARVDGRLSDPALFADICHMTPAGIERLAEAFLPAVAEVLDEAAQAAGPS